MYSGNQGHYFYYYQLYGSQWFMKAINRGAKIVLSVLKISTRDFVSTNQLVLKYTLYYRQKQQNDMIYYSPNAHKVNFLYDEISRSLRTHRRS